MNGEFLTTVFKTLADGPLTTVEIAKACLATTYDVRNALRTLRARKTVECRIVKTKNFRQGVGVYWQKDTSAIGAVEAKVDALKADMTLADEGMSTRNRMEEMITVRLPGSVVANLQAIAREQCRATGMPITVTKVAREALIATANRPRNA